MKKLFICLLLLATIGATAKQKRDDSKYLAGAVPEVGGIVTFKKSFTVADKSAEEVRKTMQAFVHEMVDNSIPAPGNYARIMEENDDSIVARVCEWLIFKKKPFNLDRARHRYTITAHTQGKRVTITLAYMSYYYNEDMETQKGIIYKAEEWITDKEALNKSQTKLYPKSGKFRRKTVDRAEAIFEAAMDLFEPKQEAQPAKVVRKGVVEE